MTEELNRIQELSSYFRNLELYCRYTESCHKHREELSRIAEHIAEAADSDEPQKEDDASFETRLLDVWHEIQENQRILDERFSGFDFSPPHVRESAGEYKIALWRLTSSVLEGRIDEARSEGRLPRRVELERSLDKLRTWFATNFAVIDGVEQVFDKALGKLEGARP